MRHLPELICALLGAAVVSSSACGTEQSEFGDGSGEPDSGFGDAPGFSGEAGMGSLDRRPSCATAETKASREPVYIDIVLDGSRSMDGHGSVSAGCDTTYSYGSATECFLANGRETDPIAPQRELKVCHDANQLVTSCPSYKGLTGKKWIAIRGALFAYFDAVKAAGDERLGLGMYLFRGEIEKPNDQWDIQPAYVDGAQLGKLRDRISPPNGYPTRGGTPLRGSINGQAPLLKAFVPTAPLEAGGKRVFLVITDGAATDGKDETVTLVNSLRTGSPSILTFVIGVGDPAATDLSVYDATFLSRMASAGGAAPAGCNPNWDGKNPSGSPCHFQVTPGQKSASQLQTEMSAAISTIAQSVQSCVLTLNKSAPIDPTRVNVLLTSGVGVESQIAKDGNNGWSYDDEANPSQVILHGSSCISLKADPAAQVSVVIGCPTGTIIR